MSTLFRYGHALINQSVIQRIVSEREREQKATTEKQFIRLRRTHTQIHSGPMYIAINLA